MAQLTHDIIAAAIEGLTARQEAIGRQIEELRAMLPGSTADRNNAPATKRGGKRALSREARERISNAQKQRWAAARGESTASAPAPTKARKKRKLSAEGRKAIQEALRKRWAAKRAEAAQAAPTKKAVGKKAAKTSKRAPANKRAAGKKTSTTPAATTNAGTD